MIAIWVGIFFFIQAVILGFTLMMCKSAALADREYMRALIIDQRTRVNTLEQIENNNELNFYADTQSVTRFGYSSSDS